MYDNHRYTELDVQRGLSQLMEMFSFHLSIFSNSRCHLDALGGCWPVTNLNRPFAWSCKRDFHTRSVSTGFSMAFLFTTTGPRPIQAIGNRDFTLQSQVPN